MTVYHSDPDKYGEHTKFAIVDTVHGAIKHLMQTHQQVESAIAGRGSGFAGTESATDGTASDEKLIRLGRINSRLLKARGAGLSRDDIRTLRYTVNSSDIE
jgi:hypothetical protein